MGWTSAYILPEDLITDSCELDIDKLCDILNIPQKERDSLYWKMPKKEEKIKLSSSQYYQLWLKANNVETISFEEIKPSNEIHELFDTMIDLYYNGI